MKYSVFVLALALTAILTIANQQKRAVGRPQPAQDGSESRESPAGQSQGNKDAKSADRPQPGRKTDTDDEPPLLLEDEPPLLLDDDPPLLLDDDGGDDPSAKGQKVADNSRCHVCHLNYADEGIAVVHAKADIGCTACHGECDEHIADESWASGGNGTPPGTMYRPEEIDACCQECHKEHDVSAQEVIARWQQRRSKQPEKADLERIVCTDCHGEHRLKERKCRWK